MVSILEKIFKKKNSLQYVFAEYQPNNELSTHLDMQVGVRVGGVKTSKKEDDMQIDKIYQSV